ncbi:MAG: carboxypeptidase-like regulatory domain-containing protein, partial [Edaphobacter sp.]
MSIIHIVRGSILGAAVAVGLLSLGAKPAHGQSQSINGTIRGQATDASGAALPGATVTIANPDVGYSNQITSGSDGYFLQPNLPLGNYKVTVSKAGFSTLNYDRVVLNAGKEVVLDAKLAVGGTNTMVEVTATASLIDPATLNLQRTLDSREIKNLPLVSRNPYNFIIFQPGVSGHPNPELGIPRSLNTNGLLDRINYEMDGMVNTQSDRTGLRLFPIGNIFVKEIQTVSNSFAPEYGETTGNVYNVISNSGTNSYHGMFQYVRRWVDASSYPYFANHSAAKPDLQLTDYSANLGGRIIKDKLFFFGSYEKLTRGSPAPVTIKPADAAALGIPADQLVAAPGLLHGTFTDERVDWNINKKNTMFVRYNYFKNTFPFNTQVGGINTKSTASDFLDRAHVIAGQLTTTVNDHLLNELRFSWPFRNNQHFAGPSGGTGPAILVSGIAAFGASSNAGDQFTDKVPSGSDNVNLVYNKHAIKFGFNLAERINRQRLLSFN